MQIFYSSVFDKLSTLIVQRSFEKQLFWCNTADKTNKNKALRFTPFYELILNVKIEKSAQDEHDK